MESLGKPVFWHPSTRKGGYVLRGLGSAPVSLVSTAQLILSSNENPMLLSFGQQAQIGDTVVAITWGVSTLSATSCTGLGASFVYDNITTGMTSCRIFRGSVLSSGTNITFNTLYRGGAYAFLLRGANINSLQWAGSTGVNGPAFASYAGGLVSAVSMINGGVGTSIPTKTPSFGWTDLTPMADARSSAAATHRISPESVQHSVISSSGSIAQWKIAAL